MNYMNYELSDGQTDREVNYLFFPLSFLQPGDWI